MERNIIRASVEKRRIRLAEYVPPTAGNVNRDFLEITLDSEWDEDRLRVAFFRESMERPVEREWDGESLVPIPWEANAEAGSFGFTVVGTTDGIDRIITVMQPMSERVRVRLNGEDEGVDPKQPTEDIIVQAIKATDRANEVSERVEGAEAQREAAFDEAQAQRSEQFTEAQQTRSNAFESDMATWGAEIATKAAEAMSAAQAARNTADNLIQRMESGEFNGKNFEGFKFSFASIAEMNAAGNVGQSKFDMAIINSAPEDPDNSKFYMWTGTEWHYVNDLSGGKGIPGPPGVQGVSLRGVEVRNATQVWVTQYDPMTEQERTYMIGDFAQPLAAGINAAVDAKLWSGTQAQYDAIATKNPNTWYGVVD